MNTIIIATFLVGFVILFFMLRYMYRQTTKSQTLLHLGGNDYFDADANVTVKLDKHGRLE